MSKSSTSEKTSLGPKLYLDPNNHFAVQIKSPSSRSPSEVMVRFMGSHYVSPIGTIYMLTQFYEIMDPTGKIYENENEINSQHAYSEPYEHAERTVGSSQPVPSAPPLIASAKGKEKKNGEEANSNVIPRHKRILNKLQAVNGH